MTMPVRPPLELSVRADLYHQLAKMETAGLPFLKSLELLRLPDSGQDRVMLMRKFVTRGVMLHVAGENSGLFTKLESQLIRAATDAGSPAATFRRLADSCTRRAAQRKLVRSRLMLPAFMLIAALFIQPLPMLVSGAITIGGYFLKALGPLAVLAGIVIAARAVPTALSGTAAQAHLDRVLPQVGLIGDYLVRRNLRDFFETLALMLEAGIPILDALPKSVETMQNSMLRESYASVETRVRAGSTLTQALSFMPCLDDGRAIGLVQTGEESGTLPEMLFRHAANETGAINDVEQRAAEWFPRIVYAIVACWIAYGIVLGSGTGPRLPQDLV